jgi:hypothetical protein
VKALAAQTDRAQLSLADKLADTDVARTEDFGDLLHKQQPRRSCSVAAICLLLLPSHNGFRLPEMSTPATTQTGAQATGEMRSVGVAPAVSKTDGTPRPAEARFACRNAPDTV